MYSVNVMTFISTKFQGCICYPSYINDLLDFVEAHEYLHFSQWVHCHYATSSITWSLWPRGNTKVSFVLSPNGNIEVSFISGGERAWCWLEPNCTIWGESCWRQWRASSQPRCVPSRAVIWLLPDANLLFHHSWLLCLHDGTPLPCSLFIWFVLCGSWILSVASRIWYFPLCV